MTYSEGWLTVRDKSGQKVQRYRNRDGSFQVAAPTSGAMQLGQLWNRMISGGAQAGSGIWSAPAKAATRPGGPSTTAPRNLGTYEVPGVGVFDRGSGQLIRPASAAPAPAAPGLGAPTPVVSPAARARQEAANQALQNAGGANISQPILANVPDAAVSASKEYAQARAASPTAELPAVLDQRSQEYGQRADIQAWLQNMQNGSASQRAIAERFLAKQRPAAPVIGQRSEAPDYSEGGAPTQAWTAADAPGPAPERGAVVGEKYYGKTWDGTQWVDDAQAPMAAGALGTQAAYGMAAEGIEFVPQATAQASNLNFNSPLPDANASQAFSDERKALAEDLAKKYRLGITELAFNVA